MIGENALQNNSRVHTFGVGKGASTDLVKNAAAAGAGTYSFIYNSNEIEEKVILALQKNYAPVQKVSSIEFFDENQEKLELEDVRSYITVKWAKSTYTSQIRKEGKEP